MLGRLILRVHYPSDVIAGMLLSYSWINFSFQIVQRYLPAPEPEEAEVSTQRRRRHSRKRKSLFVVFSLTLLFLGTLSVSARRQHVSQFAKRRTPCINQENLQRRVPI